MAAISPILVAELGDVVVLYMMLVDFLKIGILARFQFG